MKTYQELETIMDDNEDLFIGLVETGEYRFREWLKENMKIYRYFIRFAKDLKSAHKRDYYSARMIFERIRWETLIEEEIGGGVVFKINNNYAPFMSRLVMIAEHELEGMFQKRGRESDD